MTDKITSTRTDFVLTDDGARVFATEDGLVGQSHLAKRFHAIEDAYDWLDSKVPYRTMLTARSMRTETVIF